jgi:hypothetical protein
MNFKAKYHDCSTHSADFNFNYYEILKYFVCKFLFNMENHSEIGFVIIIYGLSYTEITLFYELDSGNQVSGSVI